MSFPEPEKDLPDVGHPSPGKHSGERGGEPSAATGHLRISSKGAPYVPNAICSGREEHSGGIDRRLRQIALMESDDGTVQGARALLLVPALRSSGGALQRATRC